MDKKNELLIRVYLLLAVFVLFSILIISRVVKIGLVEGDKWRDKVNSKVEWRTVKSERGNIYDVRGDFLATSLPFFDIRMDLLQSTDDVFNKGVDSLAICLARDLNTGKTAAQWKRMLVEDRRLGKLKKKTGVRYTLIANDLTLDAYEKLKTYPILRKGRSRGGLIALREDRRFKPFEGRASRTVGVDRQNADKIGLEAAYDKVLSGEESYVLMSKVTGGVWLPVFDPTEMRADKGADIVSTLDMKMQDLMHQELEVALLNQKARAATAILMDVETGAIKAMSNLANTEQGARETYNYAIGHLSEPGSTFKLASYLAMFEDGYIDLGSKVNLNGGKHKFYDRWMYDSHMHGKFVVTAAEAFKSSSNVGVGVMAQKFYGSKEDRLRFVDRLSTFGLTEKTGIELPGESKPIVKHPSLDRRKWYGTTIPWMAHGYELMETPLQMLNFCNTIANDGRLMRPYLVTEVLKDGETIERFAPKVMNEKIASQESIDKIKQLLKATVLDGTGRKVKSDKVEIAGKTGTTRVNYTAKDEKKKYNASFIGYFPADKPKYSLLVVVYEPKAGKIYGGDVAGPVFKSIAEGVTAIDAELMSSVVDVESQKVVKTYHAGFSYDYDKVMKYLTGEKGVNTKSRWVQLQPKTDALAVAKQKIAKSKIPDLKGMGLRDAVYILESLGVSYQIKGAGRVAKQSLKPGTPIDGAVCILYLS